MCCLNREPMLIGGYTGNVVDRVLKLSLPKMEAFESRNEVGNLD